MTAYKIIEYIVLFTYICIATFGIVGTSLYLFAFFNMKRSKIIGATALLLAAISLDSLWWFFTEYNKYIISNEVMMATSSLLIIKIILFICVLFFVKTSVSTVQK